MALSGYTKARSILTCVKTSGRLRLSALLGTSSSQWQGSSLTQGLIQFSLGWSICTWGMQPSFHPGSASDLVTFTAHLAAIKDVIYISTSTSDGLSWVSNDVHRVAPVMVTFRSWVTFNKIFKKILFQRSNTLNLFTRFVSLLGVNVLFY